jgi:cardiolipin synthase
MGALLDPVVDRLTILAGVVVCWHFELLPHWALVVLAGREVVTLVLAQIGLRKGADLEITWVGRVAVFLIMGGIFWAQVLDWEIIRIGFSIGVLMAVTASAMYVRAARRHVKAKQAAAGPPG